MRHNQQHPRPGDLRGLFEPVDASVEPSERRFGTRREADLEALGRFANQPSIERSLELLGGLRASIERLKHAIEADVVLLLGCTGDGRLHPWLELGAEAAETVALSSSLLDRADLESGEPLVFDGRSEGPGSELLAYLEGRTAGLRTALAMRLRSERGGAGLILAARRAPAPFEQRELEQLRGLIERGSPAPEPVRVQGDLAASEQKFRTLLLSAIDPILLYQPASRHVVELNQAAAELFGLDHSRRRPQRAAGSLQRYLEGLAEASDDVIATPSEHSLASATGERFFEARARNIGLDGERYLLVSARDTTERHRLEAKLEAACHRAEEATAAKSTFLATMSHEIRTPLGGLIGLAQLLLDTELSEEQRDWVGTFSSSGEALLGILNGVLDFSKIEAGKVALESVEYDPGRIVSEVVRLMSNVARDKGLELKIEPGADLPGLVLGDPLRLRQVLINLTANAIKFTARGGVVLRATGTGGVLRFEVEDSGIGIEPEQVKTLFQPFAQAEASTARNYGGTGLGLSICRDLVELQKGRIGARSAPTGGSCFWFELPLNPAATRPAAGSGAVEEVVSAPIEVLVVEDNAVNRKVTSRFLQKFGHGVTLAEDGQQALELLAERSFDLILMDCQMPVKDGFETVLELRSRELRDPELGHTPVVALTANVREEDRLRCFAVGMDAYLNKPIRIGELRTAIEGVLDSSRRRTA